MSASTMWRTAFPSVAQHASIAALTILAAETVTDTGVVVAFRMYETHPRQLATSEVPTASPADLIDLET